MIALQVVFALTVTAVCSIAPGFFFVRRFRWSPLEKLNGAVALSLIFVYCATFAIYALGGSSRLYWLVSIASVILGALAFRDLARLFRVRAVQQTLLAFALLLAWCLAILLVIRHFAGGGWMYDWIEHFHRTLFFLDRLPLDTRFGVYHLAARPPMMNVLAAFALAHTGARFEIFSAVFTFLNVLVLLPAVLLMRLFGDRKPLILAAIFACSPFFVQNATYTWTKLLAVFFVLLGLYLGVRRPSRRFQSGSSAAALLNATAAFVCLAAGVIVHYSAAPYLLILSLHYGWRVVRESRWKEAFTAAAASLALVFTWIGWSVLTYGSMTTFKTNTAVTSAAQYEAAGGSSAGKIAANIASTLVPHPLLNASLDAFQQKSALGYLRDYTFLIYQTNALFALGIIGAPLVLYLLFKHRVRGFWLYFLVTTVVLGIAVHGERDVFGVGHVTLQPVILLGLTFLAAQFPSLPRALRVLVILGCLADVALGVLLHQRLQNEERDTGTFGFTVDTTDPPIDWQTTLSQFALRNWYDKQARVLLAEAAASAQNPELKQRLEWDLVLLRDEDRTMWGNWYARNNERLTFLGDHARPYVTVVYITIAVLLGAFLMILAWERRRPGG